MNMHDDLRAAVAADMPRLTELLKTLIRMESVSAHGYDPEGVRSAGETIVGMLSEFGYDNAQLLESTDGQSSCTPTTTCSQPARRASGRPCRSTPSRKTGASTVVVRQTTRRES
jgi:acetylornithine deacetylase/succinyl-diaminopimelate desuccinylase-like protein